jgi:hypothetical protein
MEKGELYNQLNMMHDIAVAMQKNDMSCIILFDVAERLSAIDIVRSNIDTVRNALTEDRFEDHHLRTLIHTRDNILKLAFNAGSPKYEGGV